MNAICTELTPAERELIQAGRLFNADLAPVRAADRKWRAGSFAALWISMSACIPTYMLASSLISGGMNWWQAVITIFLGNLIVLVPMILNAHAGTRYGIPFPVYCRASFGTSGANVPALLRALVACGWFGIQTWIGGSAIYKILCIFFPAFGSGAPLPWGINTAQTLCFLLFWAVNMAVVYKGINCIRWLLNIKAPLLIALGLLLLAWAFRHAHGFGPMLSQPSAFSAGQPKAGQFWSFFFPALTGMIGYWATLSLNIPDFSRYAVSQKDQVLGQALGLPLTMALYSFIGVAVTSATKIIYGETLWDPVDVLTRFTNPVVLVIAMLALCIATLATNIAANVVSPANDFAHFSPRLISFRTGGCITGILGIVMMPWKLMADAGKYINWLISYSALLGPIGGILIADYFIWRRRRLNLSALYQPDGEYRFHGGFSFVALISLLLGVAPSIPGFLVQVKILGPEAVAPFVLSLYNYAWFTGFAVAFVAYLIGRKLAPLPSPKPATPEPETAMR
ncbi:MAG TPA: NCS1 family nucleobase:cation symporter-1 [Verrucomicrobiae bacterium]|nr:NCS1 family nucleobase:cation symporter-1 [Verrucomicrobiae bacterium]